MNKFPTPSKQQLKMTKDLIALSKRYNFVQKLQQHYFVDVFNDKKWRVGQVVQKKNIGHRPIVRIHFDGFSDQFDSEFEYFGNNKLAPFRRFSLPFTGYMQETKRVQTVNFENQYNILKEINRKEKQQLKADWIIQKYRGETFIFVDSLLTQNFKFRSQQMEETIKFLEFYIEVGINVLAFAIQKIGQISKQNISQPNVIYISPIYALTSSLPQILFNFSSLVVQKQRRVKFYYQFQNNELKSKIKNLLLSKNIVKMCKFVVQYQNPPCRGFPWSSKKQAFILLSSLGQNSIDFLKICDNREITQALDSLDYLLSKNAFTDDKKKELQVQLTLLHIKIGNFQGKIRGLNELRNILECPFIKDEIIKQKILNSSLLYSLTDNSTFNGQIFKRSIPVFEAAAKYDLLTTDILKRIITLQQYKHQLQIKPFYSALADFGKFVNEDKANYFFQGIKQFPATIETVNLIKQFTLNVANQSRYSHRRKTAEQESEPGVTYLWNLIKQQNSNSLNTSAIQAFAALSGNSSIKKTTLQKYFIECINNIKQKKNVENSLKLIHNCLKQNRQLATLIDNQSGSLVDIVVKLLIQSPSKITAQSVFEFIEQVNQYSNQKIKVPYKQQLWCSKKCQKDFLKFMRKYRSRGSQKKSDKIIHKKLDNSEIQEIIDKIFMNKSVMDNYTKIDEQAYKTIDQLLIAYNSRENNIQYNPKCTIRCRKYQNLYGLQLYLNIALNCKDEDIANQSLTRYIQYYLRPTSSKSNMKSQKMSLWAACINKLNKQMKDSPKLFVAYSILLEQMKGRMTSINILDQTIQNFTVLIEKQNRRHVITVPRCFSLWKVRQIINECFKLNNTNFKMIIVTRSHHQTNFETEEDFSAAFIMDQKHTHHHIQIIQSTQKHPHFVAIDQFKLRISRQLGEKIYDDLSTIKDINIQLLALKVLQDIPVLKNLQQKFYKLQFSKQSGWQQLLSIDCKPKLSYQLRIFKSFSPYKEGWITQFNKNGGTGHIEKLLRSISSSKTPPLTGKDYQFLTKLVEFFKDIIASISSYKLVLPFNQTNVTKLFMGERASQTQTQVPFLQYYYVLFGALKQIINCTNISSQKILKSQTISAKLEMLLLTPKQTQKQKKFPQTIIYIYDKSKCLRALSDIIKKNLANLDYKQKYSCRLFFDLLVLMFQTVTLEREDEPLPSRVIQFIKKVRQGAVQLFDEKQHETNQLICGWLRMIKCLLLKRSNPLPESQQKFAQFLIIEGLFQNGHRFESQRCRGQALDILSKLQCKNEVLNKIGEEVGKIMEKASWRKQNSWFVKSLNKRDKDAKVGFKNLSATCYINSLLQQLYYIQQFREPLLSLHLYGQNAKNQENIAYEIQKIFAFLKYTTQEVCSTESLCQNFKVGGQPIDPTMQMDVDEFFHTLMDKLECNLKKIKKEGIIDSVFQGEYSNLIIGQQCQHKSQRVQNFMSMRLQIQNKSSLNEALQQFIKGQILEGQNAYHCQKCDKKVKAMKRVCVKSLPDILILALKRFQFDFDKMQKFKLNSFCKFDQHLNMEPYMRESLYENYQKLQAESYQYKLKGVITHYGLSQAGHYTSYIRMNNDQWKYFDDDKITNFDSKQLGKECFGGIDDNPQNEDNQKMKNAYILIYERKKQKKVEQLSTDDHIKSQIDTQNFASQQIKALFDVNLQNFFDSNYQQLGKNYFIYTHLVTLRSQSRQKYLKKIYDNCISLFQLPHNYWLWYIQQFNQQLIKQFLIYGYYQAGFLVASLLIYCLTLHPSQNYVKDSLKDFLKRCLKCFDKKNNILLCKIFKAIIPQQPNYLQLLCQYKFAQKIFSFIQENNQCSFFQDIKIKNTMSQFGSPNPQFHDKKDFRNSIQMIQTVQNINFTINVSDKLFREFYKRSKKLSTQSILSKFIATKFKDMNNFKKISNDYIEQNLKNQWKIQDEYIFKSTIILLAKYCEIRDQHSKIRNNHLAKIYLNVIKQSFHGYKAMRLLLQGLFNICFTNQIFQDQVTSYLNNKQNKQLLKNLKQWISNTSPEQLQKSLQKEIVGYWRRPSRMISNQIVERIQKDRPIKPQTYSTLLKCLIQKTKISFSDIYSPTIRVGEIIFLSQIQQEEYQIISKFGLILQTKANDGNLKFILEDDAFPVRTIESQFS